MPIFKQCDDFKGEKLLDGKCLSPITFFIQNWCCQCVTVGQMQHKVGKGESFLKCCLLGWCCAICTRTINRGNVYVLLRRVEGGACLCGESTPAVESRVL